MRENKYYRSVPFLPDTQQKIPKKQKKKSKNYRKTNMGSFPAKISWTRLRKRENKNYRPVLFLPEAQQKIPKNIAKKKSKNYKIPLWLLLKPKQGGKEGE